jgi:hypothetical protein
MGKKFIRTDKSVGKAVPINPDYIINYDPVDNPDAPEKQGRYLIQFNVANLETKARDMNWSFLTRAIRDEVLENLNCCLSQNF